MSAGVNNLVDTREFTRAYEALLRHYGLTGQKIQAGQAHENGDIEQRHYRFKQAVDQALMMRGSRDFATVTAYDQFLRKPFTRINAGRRERFAEELSQLRPLPERRLDSVRRECVRVSPGSLIHVHRNTYSVHSRLIGEMVEARIKSDTVEVWYGDRKVEELARLRGRSKHRIDYRHIIDWLVRKPGAFEHYRYREDLFPTSWFRLVHDALREEHGAKRCAKEYLQILALAAQRGESLVEETIRVLLGRRDPLNRPEHRQQCERAGQNAVRNSIRNMKGRFSMAAHPLGCAGLKRARILETASVSQTTLRKRFGTKTASPQ